MENKMIEVHDNNVSEEYADILLSILSDERMDWFYNDSTVSNNEDNHYDSPQFVHSIFLDNEIMSSLYNEIAPILSGSGKPLGGIGRIKANLLVGNNLDGKEHNAPHRDADDTHFTILYYVNDSDGDTIFFDDNGNEFKRVTPKKGRMVIFDSDLLHASTPPNKGRRMVINMILNKIGTVVENVEEDVSDEEE